MRLESFLNMKLGEYALDGDVWHFKSNIKEVKYTSKSSYAKNNTVILINEILDGSATCLMGGDCLKIGIDILNSKNGEGFVLQVDEARFQVSEETEYTSVNLKLKSKLGDVYIPFHGVGIECVFYKRYFNRINVMITVLSEFEGSFGSNVVQYPVCYLMSDDMSVIDIFQINIDSSIKMTQLIEENSKLLNHKLVNFSST